MDRDYRALHVDQIVFTQYLILFAEAKALRATQWRAPA